MYTLFHYPFSIIKLYSSHTYVWLLHVVYALTGAGRGVGRVYRVGGAYPGQRLAPGSRTGYTRDGVDVYGHTALVDVGSSRALPVLAASQLKTLYNTSRREAQRLNKHVNNSCTCKGTDL